MRASQIHLQMIIHRSDILLGIQTFCHESTIQKLLKRMEQSVAESVLAAKRYSSFIVDICPRTCN